MKQAVEMKNELSASISMPTLAVLYPAKVGIKMHALSLCFISAACFSAFYAVPTNTENFKFFPTFVENNYKHFHPQP